MKVISTIFFLLIGNIVGEDMDVPSTATEYPSGYASNYGLGEEEMDALPAATEFNEEEMDVATNSKYLRDSSTATESIEIEPSTDTENDEEMDVPSTATEYPSGSVSYSGSWGSSDYWYGNICEKSATIEVCGKLKGSDERYCFWCGTQFNGICQEANIAEGMDG